MKGTDTTKRSAPGFLSALASVSKLDPDFGVEISAEKNGHLSVKIEALSYPPLKARGWPGALEAQLPAAIAKYAAWIELQETQDDADQEALIEFPRGLESKIEVPRAAAPVKPKPAKKRKVRQAPKLVRKAAPKRAATPRAPAKKQRAAPTGKPDKAACIADYQAMKAKHGDKLTRRLFVDNSTTGRRYETLWANSWPAFEKEAGNGKPAASAPAGTKATTPAKLPFPTGKKTPAPAAPKKAAKPSAPKAEKKGKDEKLPWTVKAGKKTLGATIFQKKPGDVYMCSVGTFTVKSIDEEKREIYVEPAGGKPASESPKDEAPAASSDPAGSGSKQAELADETKPATEEIK